MAITLGSLIQMVVRFNIVSGIAINEWKYTVDGSAFLVEPVQIAEAYWNHIKAAYRGLVPLDYGPTFNSILITELNNPVGDYAEYSIPVGERAGTRGGTVGEPLPPYDSVGIRLTVGSRETRPGPKRFPVLYEGDQNNGTLGAAVTTAANALMAVMTEPMILGAPAATIVLNPVVAGRDTPTGDFTRIQPVVGWVTNPRVTTQNSRKFGRGI
jgi:hypothetical protein